MFVASLMVITLSSLSQATSRGSGRSPDSVSGRRGIKTNGMNYFLTNPGSAAEDIKQTLTEGTDEEFEVSTQLQWPPLPRAWLEYSSTSYMSSNTFVGFKATPTLFGFNSLIASKLSFDFRYQVKSSFVAIASRSVKPKDAGNLFKFDDKRMKSYLSISKDTPLVGLCIYEVQFAYDRGSNFNFEILGSGQSLNSGEIQTITNTHFSQFFQISENKNSSENTERSSLSIDKYQHKCNQIYKKRLKQQVEVDFSKQIMNFVFHNHPQSTCKPTFDELHPEGDPTCKQWFEQNIHSTIQKLSVPRCVLQPGGTHGCELRAKKENVSCPVFIHSDNTYSDIPHEIGAKKVSTRNIHIPNFPCDETLGLVCELESEPFFIGKQSFGTATARCQKMKN
jgi:hypothetical protein